MVLTETYENGECTGREGDESADPGELVFAIGTDGIIGASQPDQLDDQVAIDSGGDPDTSGIRRPEHQRDTAQKPNGYPFSIDDNTRAFARIDNLRIEGNPDDTQAEAIRRLIKSRLICGISDPIVAYDRDEVYLAQRASEVCHALGRTDHEPPNPGLPDDVYRPGYEGASRSNLGMRHNSGPAGSIESWLVDAGQNNRDEIGHRRWCLTPGLYETAYAQHEGFAALLVVGNCRDNVNYDVITYPGPGYQPVEFYDKIRSHGGENLIWSIHVNPSNYQTPDSVEQLEISVTQILLDGSHMEIEVRRVRIAETPGMLDSILFTPAIEVIEVGAVYEVNIQGIQRRRRPHTFTYRVEFYEVGEND